MKQNAKYIIFAILIVFIVICGFTEIIVGNKLSNYTVETLYEDLSPIEKIVSKLSNHKFYTKEEAIKARDIIFSAYKSVKNNLKNN